MRYEIESRNDFGTGSQLIVRIPEEDLDKKALHTIQTDKPDFIFPFHCRNIDGEIEFVYQPGSMSKIQYHKSIVPVHEYCKLWFSLLDPLLGCGDWFMRPYSFVLDSNHIYFDDTKSAVCYAYIPSIYDCSDYNALKEAAVSLSKHVSIEDVSLENKVLRMIMKDFSPAELLQTLKQYETESIQASLPKTDISRENDQPAQHSKKQSSPGGDRSQTRAPQPHSTSHAAQATQVPPASKPSQALQKAASLPIPLKQEAIIVQPEIAVLEHDEYELIDGDSDSPLDIIINIPLKRKRAKSTEKQAKRKNAFSAFASR